jgi:hypothetical protein
VRKSIVNIRKILALLLGSFALLASGQSRKPAETKPAVLTVCEVLTHAVEYDGQLIRIQGNVGATDEGNWLVDEKCPGAVITEGYVWPSQIALVMPDIRPELRVHSVDFRFDWDSARRTKKKYWQLRRTTTDECMRWTFTGLFETRKDWAKARLTYPNGTWKFLGFGHLGESPAQLLMKSNDDVTAIANCRPKNEK